MNNGCLLETNLLKEEKKFMGILMTWSIKRFKKKANLIPKWKLNRTTVMCLNRLGVFLID